MGEIRFVRGAEGWYPDWPYVYVMNRPEIDDYNAAMDWCTERFGPCDDAYKWASATGRSNRTLCRWWFNPRMSVVCFREQSDAFDFKLRWV